MSARWNKTMFPLEPRVTLEETAEPGEELSPGEAFERRMDRIRETLAAARDRADILGRRLAPVLLPERPQPVGEVRPAPESPLAVTLDEILTDVEDLHDRLRHLTHRIDL